MGARRRLSAVAMASMGAIASGFAGLALADVPCPGDAVCQGTPASETLEGTPETDYLYADAGDDRLIGRGAFDDLRGEDGNDKLDGGKGSDQYNFYGDSWDEDRVVSDAGGAEDWLVFHPTGAINITVDLVPQPDRQEVLAGTNSVNLNRGVEIEWVQTAHGADQVFGSGRDEYLSGGDAGDILVGRGGDDLLIGDIAVFADSGEDTIRAGKGNDTVNGGEGNDTVFVRDGERDEIECGDGNDTVAESDAKDDIASDCETVVR